MLCLFYYFRIYFMPYSTVIRLRVHNIQWLSPTHHLGGRDIVSSRLKDWRSISKNIFSTLANRKHDNGFLSSLSKLWSELRKIYKKTGQNTVAGYDNNNSTYISRSANFNTGLCNNMYYMIDDVRIINYDESSDSQKPSSLYYMYWQLSNFQRLEKINIVNNRSQLYSNEIFRRNNEMILCNNINFWPWFLYAY